MRTVTFLSKNEQGLIVKYGDNKPKKAIIFVNGFYRTRKEEEIDALMKLIKRRAISGLFVAKIYEEPKKEESKKEESKKEESKKEESKKEESKKEESKKKGIKIKKK